MASNFVAVFSEEFKEKIVKEEPKEEWNDPDEDHDEVVKDLIKNEIKEEIKIECHEINTGENPEMAQEAQMELDSVEMLENDKFQATKIKMKRPLTDKELLKLMESGLSDIEMLSDEDDDFEDGGRDLTDDSDDEGQNLVEDTAQADAKMEIGEPLEEMDDPLKVPSDKGVKKAKSDLEAFMKEHELTPKHEIVWMKNVSYVSPAIKWHEEEHPQATELSPLDFFNDYFTDDLFQLMVDKTNLYATQKHSKFVPTTITEMRTFIGVHIAMGNCHYPRIKCYWQRNLSIPIISDNMPINRFYKLRQHLHVVDIEESLDKNDRLWKIRPLFDQIRAHCLTLPLETDLCIGEQMIPFKGHLNIKQYMKSKPTKWGIKLFALCGRSGQLYDFIIYQGSTTKLTQGHEEVFGLGGAIVTTLAKRITGVNFRLYFDDFFSNYNMLQYLRSKFTYACCTARVDRFQNPPFSSDADLKKNGRGSFEEVLSKDGIVMTKWCDNKSLIMASNYKGVGNSDTCKRWDRSQKEYVKVPRPEIVKDYSVCVGGVDKMDFLITLYRTLIRSKKWTLRMLTHAIDLACTNAWLEYKKQALLLGVGKRGALDLLRFRAYIAEGLIKANKTSVKNPSSPAAPTESTSRRSNEVRPIVDVRFDQLGHFPSFDNKSFATRCKNSGCKGQSRVFCLKCNVHLCLYKNKNCFQNYHLK